jgi:hypothetical protein
VFIIKFGPIPILEIFLKENFLWGM